MTIRRSAIADPTAPLVAWEFFAGGGLAGLGLSQAGIQTHFANDIDPAKAVSFRLNHAGVAFHQGDVWNLSPSDLIGVPDLCWASSPCQDVSLAGVRGGLAAPRSGAFWGFWHLMRGLIAEGRAPRVIVIENVVGLLSSGGGRDFAAVCQALVEGGYQVGALEMDAALWLPQSRPRLFVVACRGERADLSRPAPVAPFHSRRVIAAHAGLPQAVRDRWSWWTLPMPPKRNLDLAAVLENDADVDWLDPDQTAALVALTAAPHRARLEAGMDQRLVAAAFRRVRTEDGRKVQRLEVRVDGLAGCLRTPSGGSSRQYVLIRDAVGLRARRLTGREAARLMGVDETYALPSRQSAALKLMGDAVAVPVVRALAQGLLVPLLQTRSEYRT